VSIQKVINLIIGQRPFPTFRKLKIPASESDRSRLGASDSSRVHSMKNDLRSINTSEDFVP